MGLVTCSKCRKIYDYEKYSGICPKCARYNSDSSAAEEHQELHDRYDGGYSHNAQDDHHSYHQKYDENPNPHGSEVEVLKETLEGVQKRLRDVAGTTGRMVTFQMEEAAKNPQEKKKMDKRTKLIIGIIIVVFGINVILPILLMLFSAVFMFF